MSKSRNNRPPEPEIVTLPHITAAEPEPEPAFEFETVIIEFKKIPAPMNSEPMLDPTPADIVKVMLESGWEIDDKIICAPFALIVFSREITEEIEHE